MPTIDPIIDTQRQSSQTFPPEIMSHNNNNNNNNNNTIMTVVQEEENVTIENPTATTAAAAETTTTACCPKKNLQNKIYKRMASLTEAEAYFLHALLIDDDDDDDDEPKKQDDILSPKNEQTGQPNEMSKATTTRWEKAARVLDDDILFSIPPIPEATIMTTTTTTKSLTMAPSSKRNALRRAKRRSITDLWRAHEDGVSPKRLAAKGSLVLAEEQQQQQKQKQQSQNQPLSSKQSSASNQLNEVNKPSPPPPQQQQPPLASPSRSRTNSRASSGGLPEDLEGGSSTIDSDQEVLGDDHSSNSSWDENEDDLHFDTWDVLKNDYASDFGFDYTERPSQGADDEGDDDDIPTSFRILGTSADDTSAQPHVLSPPLMDALSNFLPDVVKGQNYWLKFSLVRDGASLDTLRRYVRACKYTILAIETDKGEVFGSFTSSSWHITFGFYGSAPCFVWKMRHSRRTKCASLFDQAQLESEIDVFFYTKDSSSEYEQNVQVCRHNYIALGGDNDNVNKDGNDDDEYGGLPSQDLTVANTKHDLRRRRRSKTQPSRQDSNDSNSQDDENNNNKTKTSAPAGDDTTVSSSSSYSQHPYRGFAYALEGDLLRGTTSPCETFKSPSLCGRGDRTEVFYVAGIEVWTLTPCIDVNAAEKLEMTKFFIEESSRHTPSASSSLLPDSPSSVHSIKNSPRSLSAFSSQDLIQSSFYQRVGYDYQSQERRDRWSDQNMQESVGRSGRSGAAKPFGQSPRFG